MTTPRVSSSTSSAYLPTKTQHLTYLRQTISLAKLSPPKPSNFRVGCVLVSYPPLPPSTTSTTTTPSSAIPEPKILSTGFTLELPTNTHAEQNALSKLTLSTSTIEEELYTLLPRSANIYLYTSLEPCSKRLSGNKPCVNRIIDTRRSTTTAKETEGEGEDYGIQKVIFGAKEPDTFVGNSQSCRLLSEAGVEWEYIPDLEEEILRVAMEGHVKKGEEQGEKPAGDMSSLHDRVDAMSAGADKKTGVSGEEEKKRQEAEAQPRNPKKRMMEYLPQ